MTIEQSKTPEISTVAWLIQNYSGFGEQCKAKESVVMSPLTDETCLDEGDEAHALCRQEDAEELIKRATDFADAMKAGLAVAAADLTACQAANQAIREALERAFKHHCTTSLPLAIRNYGSAEAAQKEGMALWFKGGVIEKVLAPIVAAQAPEQATAGSEPLAPTTPDAAAPIALAPLAGGWVSVKDRLPPHLRVRK